MSRSFPLEYDGYFHIYNRGINGEILFREPENFEYFIQLYNKYLNPVIETFAWVLMSNHFHFLVRIRDKHEIGYIETNNDIIYHDRKEYDPVRQLSHFFNAYTKAYNKRYKRTGGLFESPFRRILVENDSYLKILFAISIITL